MSEETARQVVVVGVDGSDLSVDALRWAVRQAQLTRAEVLAVMAWEVPLAFYPSPTFADVDLQGDAEQVLSRAVAEVVAEAGDVPIRQRLMHQQARSALVDAARGAQLLVVGSHGVGTLPGLHLGSIASYCVHHSPCPVLVFRTASTGR